MRKIEDSGFNFKRYIVSTSLGALIGMVFSLLALLGLTALVLSETLSVSASGIAVSAMLFVGALIGGAFAKKRGAGGVLIAGPTVGVLMFLLCCLVRMIFYGQFFPGDSGFANFIAAIAGGSVGALIASGMRPKKRKSRQRA